MKTNLIGWALCVGLSMGCTSPQQVSLPSWNDTPVKEQLVRFLNEEADKIPVEDRIAVFDMDGTLVCERPFGIETMVSIHRLLEQGERDSTVRQTREYEYARKLSVNPRDTSVLNHCYENGQNYLANIILKPFDGADCEEYVRFANRVLNTCKHPDHGRVYADMFYQPMLELVAGLKQKQFQIYVVSASMQGIVWSICPQELGVDRQHLLGIRHPKRVRFASDGKVSYVLKGDMMSPVNNHDGKAINIYDHIGKLPVVAVGNAYSDWGMFRLTSASPYPHLALLLHHDDVEREYVYAPCHGSYQWQDTLKRHQWLQADMSKEFKVVWKKK